MKMYNIKVFGAIGIIFLLLSSTCLSVASAGKGSITIGSNTAFTKGIPWQPFKPIKKTTLVQFDKETLTDDYEYLASIPASVFSDGETIYTSPLLLFQPDNTYPSDKEYRFLNDYSGTHYFMEDWMGYCNGQLDKLITINVDKGDLESSWISKEQTQIDGEDPFQITSEIVLDEWSYADEVIIAVIEEDYEKPTDSKITGLIGGEISGEVGMEHMTIARPYGPASEYEYFTVDDEYKYVKVDLWYPAFVYSSKILDIVPGFGPDITLPSVDPDLQIFCKYDGDWLQTSASAEMAISGGPHEQCLSYVYASGDWRVGVTNMPTEGGMDGVISDGPLGKGKIKRYGSFKDALISLIKGVENFNIYITKYPGVESTILDLPPFGCRDATFTLKWGSDDTLGLTIIGPSGEELDSIMNEDTDKQELHFDMLGECMEGEHYKVVVYALDDISHPVDYTIEYSWQQNITRKELDLLASACQGAILGSTQNNPMLYITPDEVPTCTKDTLYKLGVKQLNIVDLGGYLSKEAKDELSNIAKIKNHYTEYKDVYDAITEITGSNDVVFSTIDPWSYWHYTTNLKELKPAGEFEKAFYFGPAAYAAAHHGSPLLLVDNHPELSGAVTWHGDFWKKNANGFTTPPTVCMFITGRKVYDFLDEYGFDKKGVESILTVAGQYDIGPTWARVFAGVAHSGNIIGTPVDTTNHISRCIFYPGLIFENPAVEGTVELETGSESVRSFHVDGKPLNIFEKLRTRLSRDSPGLTNLKITSPSHVEEFTNPVLHTYGAYCHRVNERGSDYWGINYITRNGYTPGVDLSAQEIDQGTREIFEGKKGCFLPDIAPSVYTPFYAEKAGYSNAFSNNFDITMDNLNQGVISWYMVNHGMSDGGGWLSWWEPPSELLTRTGVSEGLGKLFDKGFGLITGSLPYEDTNPWRGYDMGWGSTKEPDSAVLNSKIGVIPGWTNSIRFRDLLEKGWFKIGLDVVPSHLAGYHDGQVGPYSITGMIGKFHYSHPASEVDDKLENLHSMNFHAGSCLIGCNYFQITFMRHGSVLQEMDPWSTSYWCSYALQQIPKDFALGESVGESYAKGITEIGPKYIFEKDEEERWWWDDAENVVLFADPDMHIWIPSTEYDSEASNHWEREDFESLRYNAEFSVDGHTPFGATDYPHEKEPLTFLQQYLVLIIAIAAIMVLVIVAVCLPGKNK